LVYSTFARCVAELTTVFCGFLAAVFFVTPVGLLCLVCFFVGIVVDVAAAHVADVVVDGIKGGGGVRWSW
jgi:hypothetical protein